MMNQRMRRIIKKTYVFLFKPFFKNGILLKMGKAGSFRFDYIFAVGNYRRFGSAHNSGFAKWLECCRGKKVVFDIGAHIGLYSIPASALVDPEGAIYAFEPSEANRMYLERHIGFNSARNINVIPFLAGETSIEGVPFFENRRVDPMNSVALRKDPGAYEKVNKRQVSLDDFCAARGLRPEVVKIDVEGAEMKVLRGAQKTLAQARPIVFLSIHPRTLAALGESVYRLIQMISGMGYRYFSPDGKEAGDIIHNEYILISKERDSHEVF